MEEDSNAKSDLNGNLVRPPSLRPIGVLKSTPSGRLTPRSSPTYRRLNSVRTPRRDGRGSGGGFTQWFRSSRLLYWLLLITLWTYGGFYIQSKWAHGDNGENSVGFGNTLNDDVQDSVQNQLRRELAVNDGLVLVTNGSSGSHVDDVKAMANNNLDVAVAKERNGTSPPRSTTSKKRGKKSARIRGRRKKKTAVEEDMIRGEEVQVEEIPLTNASYGSLVGPFGSIEDRVLEWSPVKRTGTCDRNELFARLVWSRNFVLIFHELSMTGAPLSMLELATELLSCGATVHAVVLSRRGGLMSELTRRRIKVIDDKAEQSFKAAMKADLVIAGSAVCASWIGQYLTHFTAGSNQIAWWIMENRREYFDRSKLVLNRVKMLIFLSELQSKQWLAWSEEENIKLNAQIALIPLSVNDELAFVAGLMSSLNTPRFTPETMLAKRQVLRNAIRQEMGLTDNDMLVLTLSSINAPKGQLLLFESAHLIINEQQSHSNNGGEASIKLGKEKANLTQRFRLRGLLKKKSQTGASLRGLRLHNRTNVVSGVALSIGKSVEQVPGQNLKLLIGSVGSKSNKVLYVKEILEFLSHNPNLSESVLWTPATTRVASLYSAADVYVINAQGLGETFGRVTIEAMAFGLPVLGTDAGGTKEIVEHNVTGLLHPIGRPGTRMLAENLRFLLRNPSAKLQMGMKGREKVEKMYMKRHMYKMFFEVLFKCMKIK